MVWGRVTISIWEFGGWGGVAMVYYGQVLLWKVGHNGIWLLWKVRYYGIWLLCKLGHYGILLLLKVGY